MSPHLYHSFFFCLSVFSNTSKIVKNTSVVWNTLVYCIYYQNSFFSFFGKILFSWNQNCSPGMIFLIWFLAFLACLFCLSFCLFFCLCFRILSLFLSVCLYWNYKNNICVKYPTLLYLLLNRFFSFLWEILFAIWYRNQTSSPLTLPLPYLT